VVLARNFASVEPEAAPPSARIDAIVRSPILQVKEALMSRTGGNVRVLAVDDDRPIADSVGTILAAHNHSVRVSYCVKDAITIAANFAPHFVISDVGMPQT
jgi:PleD family two-component response regulator